MDARARSLARKTARLILVATALCLAYVRASLAVVMIDHCGVYVPDGELAVLTQDLQCGGTGPAFEMGGHTTLQLNGHTLSEDPRDLAPNPYYVIACYEEKCTIVGPGEIAGANVNGVWAREVELRDLVLHHNGSSGVYAERMLLATNVLSHDNGAAGLEAIRTAIVTDVTTRNNGGPGIAAFKRLFFDGLTSTDNEDLGVVTRVLRGTGLTATGNAQPGVYTESRPTLTDAVVTGNAAGRFGTGETEIDIVSRRRPRGTGITCGRSLHMIIRSFQPVYFGPWGVCTND